MTSRLLWFGLSILVVACGSSSSGGGEETDGGSSVDSTAIDSGGADTASDSSAIDDGADSEALDSAPDSTSDSSGDASPHDDGGFIDASTLCTASERYAKWTSMIEQPITLPNHAAGLDLVGDGFGLTIGEAETTLCASDALGDQFGDGTLVAGWGESDEVWFRYHPSDGRALGLHVWMGYIGSVAAKSADGLHRYVFPVGTQITKDDAPFVLPVGWKDDAGFPAIADEIYRALVHTYAPSITPLAGSNCLTDKTCLVGSFGDVGYFFVSPLGFAFWVDNRNAAEPVPSIPTRIDVELVAP